MTISKNISKLTEFLPDFTTEELHQFFLKAEVAETESRRDRVKNVFRFAQKFTDELKEKTESNILKNELTTQKNNLFRETGGFGLTAKLLANKKDAQESKKGLELEVRILETDKRKIQILQSKNMSNFERERFRELRGCN